MEKFREYLQKRFKPEIAMVYNSLFFDIIPALTRGGAKATEKVRAVCVPGRVVCVAATLLAPIFERITHPPVSSLSMPPQITHPNHIASHHRHQDGEEVSLLAQALRHAARPRTRQGSVSALKAYVTKEAGDVFSIEESYLKAEEEEGEETPVPAVVEEELAAAGSP